MKKNILKYCFALWGIAAVIIVAAAADILIKDIGIGVSVSGNFTTEERDINIEYQNKVNDGDMDEIAACSSGEDVIIVSDREENEIPCENEPDLSKESGFTTADEGVFTMPEEYIPLSSDGTISISCWGDSLTEGYGASPAVINTPDGTKDISFYNTPQTLQDLTSIDTYNFGVSGETSYEIALRAGGIPIYTDRDLYINNYFGVNALLVDENGAIVYMDDYSGYGNENNEYPDAVIINNRLCKVQRINDSQEVMISLYPDASKTEYEEMKVPAGTLVVPKAAVDHRNDILVLEMGSNGGWGEDYEFLIEQYRGIIDFCKCTNYIIVGDTDDPGTSLADYNQKALDENDEYIGMSDTSWEAALRGAFGEHFLNARTYLIENGLSDCGLLAGEEDTAYAQMGFVSPQLREDWTHFNSYGYYSKGMALYLKGVELGYWK